MTRKAKFQELALRAAYVLLLVLVATAPIPHGAVERAGVLRLQLLSFAVAALAFLGAPAGSFRSLSRPVRLAAAAIGAVGLLGLLQLLPLPFALLRVVSPASAAVYGDTAEVLALHARAAPAGRISVAPFETASVALLAAAFGLVLLVAPVLLSSRRARRGFCAAVLAGMTLEVAAAVAVHRLHDRLSGPFVNPDHFAGFLAIGLPLAFAVLWTSASRWAGELRRARFLSGSLELGLVNVVLAVFLWALLASGIALTRSRGGILAAAAGTVLFAALSVAFRRGGEGSVRWERIAPGVAGLLLALLFTGAAIGGRPLLRFLATDPRDLGADTRVQLWSASLEAWREAPLLGTGLGTFREAFRPVQPRDLVGHVETAHSDPLQLLVTGGVAGTGLAFVAAGALVVLLSRGAAGQPHREERGVTVASLAALASVLLHGLVEFDFSLPATPLTLAAVLGCGVAAAAWRERSDPAYRRAAATTSARPPASPESESVTRP